LLITVLSENTNTSCNSPAQSQQFNARFLCQDWCLLSMHVVSESVLRSELLFGAISSDINGDVIIVFRTSQNEFIMANIVTRSYQLRPLGSMGFWSPYC
jgi:hypothetical protein